MIRVVLDTNVVVSAMLRSGGLPDAVFNLATGGELQCYVSEPILAEYEEVMRRPRLGINPEKVTVALGRIRGAALLVHPVARVTVALDPDDNIFLECAEASAAHFLVTGNTRHFPPRWAVTHIVTPRQFMDARSLVSAEPA